MRRPFAGFTMVEVLVAVLLLAVGLVGALAMQAHAMRTRQESALQTEALQAAATLADRIRANAAQSSAYLGFEFDASVASRPPDAPPSCVGVPCDTAAIARFELTEFRRHLAAALPLARAVICRDSGAAPGGQFEWPCSGEAGAPVVIKIGWRSRRPDGATANFAASPGIALPIALAVPPPAPPPGTPADPPDPTDPPAPPSGELPGAGGTP